MKVVLAPDSFKEAMTAAEAAAAMARGVRAVVPDAEIVEVPMSEAARDSPMRWPRLWGLRCAGSTPLTPWGARSQVVWR